MASLPAAPRRLPCRDTSWSSVSRPSCGLCPGGSGWWWCRRGQWSCRGQGWGRRGGLGELRCELWLQGLLGQHLSFSEIFSAFKATNSACLAAKIFVHGALGGMDAFPLSMPVGPEVHFARGAAGSSIGSVSAASWRSSGRWVFERTLRATCLAASYAHCQKVWKSFLNVIWKS